MNKEQFLNEAFNINENEPLDPVNILDDYFRDVYYGAGWVTLNKIDFDRDYYEGLKDISDDTIIEYANKEGFKIISRPNTDEGDIIIVNTNIDYDKDILPELNEAAPLITAAPEILNTIGTAMTIADAMEEGVEKPETKKHFSVYKVITDREYTDNDLKDDELAFKLETDSFEEALDALEDLETEGFEGVIKDNEVDGFITEQEIDNYKMSKQFYEDNYINITDDFIDDDYEYDEIDPDDYKYEVKGFSGDSNIRTFYTNYLNEVKDEIKEAKASTDIDNIKVYVNKETLVYSIIKRNKNWKTIINNLNNIKESLTEGRADIYNDLEDEYFKALEQAEENGTVTFIVKENEDDEDYEEFDTFEEAKLYAQEHNIDKIYVPEFTICYGDYCDGDYDEYAEQILDLDKNIITKGLKEIISEDVNSATILKQVRDWAKDDYENGTVLSSDDFEEFKKILIEDHPELEGCDDDLQKFFNEYFETVWSIQDNEEDDFYESLEGDAKAQEYIDSKNDNFEKDKETTREVRKELAKQGIATDEEGKPISERLNDNQDEVVEDFLEFLSDHETAKQDFVNFFHLSLDENGEVVGIEKVHVVDIIDWIMEHPQLQADFETFIGYDLDESLKESKYDRLINSYYVVDCDNEIKGQFLDKEEAKNLVKELKNTAKDYIYVTRNAEYEGDEGRVPDFEDIVNVEKQDNNWKIFVDKFNIFENGLTEKNWKNQLPNDIALKFRQAINSDNIQMKEMIEATNSVLDYILKEYPDSDYEVEEIKANMQMINLDDYVDGDFAEYEDEEGYYQSNADYFNEEVLNPLYDLCDDLDLWIPTEALIDESLNEQQIMDSEDYIIEALLKHEIKYDQDGNKFYFTTEDDLIEAEEIICQIVGDKYTKNTRNLTIEVDFDNLEEDVNKDDASNNKEKIKKQIAELEKERAELETEIDNNDNNPNYNLAETHKILKEIDKKIAKLKEEIGE